ncbi:hypothetical protein [Paraflavitalea pollutisoli]|uniref:hypothetical protein n=1 Tax=Paraflavitalea pollutisoli TaxID=3034143 RepID=UPI0023EC3D34|nr:hypothetical protein [Paraflavitalea sp. H1-2-19X]
MLKKRFTAVVRLLLVGLLLIGTSMTVKADTVDNYQIYLRDSLVGNEQDRGGVVLRAAHIDDTLKIIYIHCGMYYGERKLVLKDDHGKVVLQVVYPELQLGMMVLPVRQIALALQKQPHVGTLKFFDGYFRENGAWITQIRVDMPWSVLTPAERILSGNLIGPGGWLVIVVVLITIVWRIIAGITKTRTRVNQ